MANVLIDAGALAELKAAAADGLAARAEHNTARREGIVAKAVEEGRIAAATRETWLAQLEANEDGTVALLASLAVNTIPVFEIGHSDTPGSSADADYYALFPDERPDGRS